MIVFIHGFGSSGKSSKAEILKNYFGENCVFAPNLSHIPQIAIEQLIKKITHGNGNITFVGSSLGGYYALHLMNKFSNSKCVLVNPAIRADRDLKARVGKNINYKTGEEFMFTEEHIVQLEKMWVDTRCIDQKNILLLLQTGDNLLDYTEALELLPNSQKLVIEGGNHEFEEFDKMCPIIEKFIGWDYF